MWQKSTLELITNKTKYKMEIEFKTDTQLLQTAVSSRFFDSNGVELKEGDVFKYTSKKWKSKNRNYENDTSTIYFRINE